MKVPDSVSLLQFFSAEPTHIDESRGLIVYQGTIKGIFWKFSYSVIEKSVQVQMKQEGVLNISYVQEDASEIELDTLDEKKLRIKFGAGDLSRWTFKINPEVQFDGFSLIG
jgi:hypothetical protein